MDNSFDDERFNVLSLCSGIAGLDLGLRLAVENARTVCYVEREAYACQILTQRIEEGHLDTAPLWTDLRTFDGIPWRGAVDCIIGGYPCQPFSGAGLRKGKEDPRHLWPRIAEIIADVQPGWCFFENVSGHLSLGFSEVYEDLERMGFRVAAGLFTASEVGAGHRRERLFILAHANSQRGKASDTRSTAGKLAIDASGSSEELADTDGQRLQRFGSNATEIGWEDAGGSTGLCSGADIPAFPPGPNALDLWRTILQTHPHLEPAIRRVVDGTASRVDQLRALGNGVVPAVAARAFVTLYRALAEQKQKNLFE